MGLSENLNKLTYQEELAFLSYHKINFMVEIHTPFLLPQLTSLVVVLHSSADLSVPLLHNISDWSYGSYQHGLHMQNVQISNHKHHKHQCFKLPLLPVQHLPIHVCLFVCCKVQSLHCPLFLFWGSMSEDYRSDRNVSTNPTQYSYWVVNIDSIKNSLNWWTTLASILTEGILQDPCESAWSDTVSRSQ